MYTWCTTAPIWCRSTNNKNVCCKPIKFRSVHSGTKFTEIASALDLTGTWMAIVVELLYLPRSAEFVYKTVHVTPGKCICPILSLGTCVCVITACPLWHVMPSARRRDVDVISSLRLSDMAACWSSPFTTSTVILNNIRWYIYLNLACNNCTRRIR